MTHQPPTWFDQRPNHPVEPAEYQAAMDAVDAAWQEYQAYCDTVFDGETVTPEQHARIKALLVAACAAEDAKDAAYQRWMTSGLDAEYIHEPTEYDEHSGAFLP